MRTILAIMLISLMNIAIITAQNRREIPLDVAGLNPYKNFSDKEIKQALGQPTQYILKDNDEGGKDREYHYGPPEKHDIFDYQVISGVLQFVLKTPTFSLFKGRIKIGKNISVFSTLEGGILEKKSQNLYYFYPLGNITEDYLEVKTNSAGTIEFIIFCPPI